MDTSKAAAVYVRISKDTPETLVRQEKQCRSLAKGLGWTVTTVLSDNDISAYTGKTRPGWNSLLKAIGDGEIDAFITYRTDRTWRKMRTLEDLIDLVEDRQITIATVSSGEIDLTTAEGRAMARQQAVWNQLEVEKMSERVKAQKEESASNGWWQGGRRPYGYSPKRTDDGKSSLEVIPEEAEIVTELAERILAGESLRSLATELNERGVPTAGDAQWRVTTISNTMTGASIAAMRVHNGKIAGQANWEAILDTPTWERVRAVLKSRSKVSQGRPATHLLTGLLECGKCGGTLYYRKGHYVCQRQPERPNCGGTSIHAFKVETFIAQAQIEGAKKVTEVEVPDLDTNTTTDEIEEFEERMDRLSILHNVEGELTEREYLAARGVLADKVAALREELGKVPATKTITITDHAEMWEEASFEDKRLVLKNKIDKIVVGPGQRGNKDISALIGRLEIHQADGQTWKQGL